MDPQGFFFGLILFILYATPLTVKSYSAANHQLYAGTQLLLSFSSLNFSHDITHPEYTISNVSNRMSANFTYLNPSKTEFFIFGLPQQLFKLNNLFTQQCLNVTLSPVHSARNLGVIFDKNLLFAQQISAASRTFTIFVT